MYLEWPKLDTKEGSQQMPRPVANSAGSVEGRTALFRNGSIVKFAVAGSAKAAALQLSVTGESEKPKSKAWILFAARDEVRSGYKGAVSFNSVLDCCTYVLDGNDVTGSK